MSSPSFWWQDARHPGARLLAPFGKAYGAIAQRRMMRSGLQLQIPVLCVGNFVVGGAGKTPAALALGRRLMAGGENVFFLSRGYRSAAEHGSPVRVEVGKHRAEDVGDEALLLARVAPTVVAADRAAAAQCALSDGASVLILDDGLQNSALAKDLRLAVVDGTVGIGNGLSLPAGPLRAPLAAQIDFIDAVIVVGSGAAGEELAEKVRAAGKPVLNASLIAEAAVAAKLARQRVYAFAGLGRPSKFYETLAEVGAEIPGTADFGDHHFYSAREIARLQQAAADENALLVTTEKDFARLAGHDEIFDRRYPPPLAVPVSMRFSEEVVLDELIAAALHRRAR